MLSAKGLVCPLDQTPLQLQGNSLHCQQGHSFDLAKQGYCHLLPVQAKRSKDPGDSKAMVAARGAFLDSGLYQAIADFMLEQTLPLLLSEQESAIADAGCGEGYYLSQLQQACEAQQLKTHCIGFDISKWAVQKAARRNQAVSWLVASNRQPPIEANYLDAMLCMFGFAQYQAFANSLKPGGLLIMLDAGPDHLIELREMIYDQIKPARTFDLGPAQEAGFELISERRLSVPDITLNSEQISQLMLMTPHFFRASAEAKAKLAEQTQLKLTLDVECRIFRATK